MSQLKRTVLITASLVLVAVVGKSGSEIYQAIKDQAVETGMDSEQPEPSLNSANPDAQPFHGAATLPIVSPALKRNNIPICDFSQALFTSYDHEKAVATAPNITPKSFGGTNDQGIKWQMKNIMICPHGNDAILFTEQATIEAPRYISGGLIATKFDLNTGAIINQYEYPGSEGGLPPDWELLQKKQKLLIRLESHYGGMDCSYHSENIYDLHDNSVVHAATQQEGEFCATE